jgi:hypothetical protein
MHLTRVPSPRVVVARVEVAVVEAVLVRHRRIPPAVSKASAQEDAVRRLHRDHSLLPESIPFNSRDAVAQR